MKTLLAMIARDFRYVFFQWAMLFSSIVRALLWMLVIGGGFAYYFQNAVNYHTFLFPGVIALVVLFSGILSNLLLVQDQEKSVFQLFLMAPISRPFLILCRLISGALLSMIHGIIVAVILLLIPSITVHMHYGLFFMSFILLAFLASAIGCLLATTIKRYANFSVAVNFIIFPLFFLSTALYPMDKLPEALRWFVMFNPYNDGIELLRCAMGVTTQSFLWMVVSVSILLFTTLALYGLASFSLIKKYGK